MEQIPIDDTLRRLGVAGRAPAHVAEQYATELAALIGGEKKLPGWAPFLMLIEEAPAGQQSRLIIRAQFETKQTIQLLRAGAEILEKIQAGTAKANPAAPVLWRP